MKAAETKDISLINIEQLFLIASWILFISCIVWRVYLMFDPKDLWIDELYIWDILKNASILNILSGVFESSAHSQSAPLLFMLLNRLVLDSAGPDLINLYLLSFIFSCSSVILIWSIGGQFGKVYQFAILFLFSLCLIPLYYTTELKQYGWELFASLLILNTALKNFKSNLTNIFSKKNLLLYIFCILISTPAIIYLAAILLVQFLYFISDFHNKSGKNLNKIYNRIIIFIKENYFKIAILAIFIAGYYIFYLGNTNSSHMKNYWSKYYIPLNPEDWLNYFNNVAFPIFIKALFWPRLFGIVLFPCFLIGLLISYKTNRVFFWLLVAPIIATIAVNTGIYPPGQPDAPHGARLLLFLIPNIVMLASWTIYKVIIIFIQNVSLTIKKISLVSIPSICAVFSILWNIQYISQNEYHCEQVESLISIINKNYQDGDAIYIGKQTELAYKYFSEIGDINYPIIILQENYEDLLQQILKNASKNASFILFTHYGALQNYLPDKMRHDLQAHAYQVIEIQDIGSILFIIWKKHITQGALISQ